MKVSRKVPLYFAVITCSSVIAQAPSYQVGPSLRRMTMKGLLVVYILFE